MEESGWDWGTVPQWLTLLAIGGFAICITLWLANVVEELRDLTRQLERLGRSSAGGSDD